MPPHEQSDLGGQQPQNNGMNSTNHNRFVVRTRSLSELDEVKININNNIHGGYISKQICS